MPSTLGAFWFRSNRQKLIIALWETGTHFTQAPYLLPFFNSFVKKLALQRKLFSPCLLPSQFMCRATGPLELAHISACGQAAQPWEVSQYATERSPLLTFLPMELWAGLRIGYFVLSCLWHLSQWPVCAVDVGWGRGGGYGVPCEAWHVWECPGSGVIAPLLYQFQLISSHLAHTWPSPSSHHRLLFFPLNNVRTPNNCSHWNQKATLNTDELESNSSWVRRSRLPTDEHSHLYSNYCQINKLISCAPKGIPGVPGTATWGPLSRACPQFCLGIVCKLGRAVPRCLGKWDAGFHS